MSINFNELESLRNNLGRFDQKGNCSDYAEDVIATLGHGTRLQFYAERNGMTGFHEDYIDFNRAYEINTPFNGTWVYGEFAYHTVAYVDGHVIDLFFSKLNDDIQKNCFTLEEYCNIIQLNNNEKIVYYESK